MQNKQMERGGGIPSLGKYKLPLLLFRILHISKMTAILTCAILVKYLSKYIYGCKHWKTFRWGMFYVLFLTLHFFSGMWRNIVNFFASEILI